MLQQSGRPKSRVSVRALALALVSVASVALTACSGNESYPNNPKPPAVLTIGVVIAEDDIVVSPTPFGAGPTRFVITNQTGTKQFVTLTTDRIDRKVLVDTNQTANFKQTLEPGFLSIDASNTAANTKEIVVGPERESAQQDLDQP